MDYICQLKCNAPCNPICMISTPSTKISVGMGSANERGRYYVTPSLIGRAQFHNDPWEGTGRFEQIAVNLYDIHKIIVKSTQHVPLMKLHPNVWFSSECSFVLSYCSSIGVLSHSALTHTHTHNQIVCVQECSSLKLPSRQLVFGSGILFYGLGKSIWKIFIMWWLSFEAFKWCWKYMDMTFL